jgi:hypothetical protein
MTVRWNASSTMHSQKTCRLASHLCPAGLVAAWWLLGVEPLGVGFEMLGFDFREVNELGGFGPPFGFQSVTEELGAANEEVVVDMEILVAGLDRDRLPGDTPRVSVWLAAY